MQLLSALDYLSRRDPYVVHRDIKPKNIFLKVGTCVLGDFGLVFQDVAPAETAQRGGTIPAMPQRYPTPELVEYQAAGKKPPPASDVFQLGLVAAELFTGKNPLKPGGMKNLLPLDPLVGLTGAIGETITALLEEMIKMETKNRLSACVLLPQWLDLYRTVIRRHSPRQTEPIVRELAVPQGVESIPRNPTHAHSRPNADRRIRRWQLCKRHRGADGLVAGAKGVVPRCR